MTEVQQECMPWQVTILVWKCGIGHPHGSIAQAAVGIVELGCQATGCGALINNDHLGMWSM